MDSLPINITDLAILIVLGISTLLALLRGFVAELFTVVAWIGALAAAVYGYTFGVPYVVDLVGLEGTLAELLSGLAIFVVALIVLSVLARLCSGVLQIAGLGAVDRSLGFLFGLVRGAVLVSVAYLLVLWAVPDPKDHPAWLTEAKALPIVIEGADLLVDLVPAHMRSQAYDEFELRKRQAEDEAREKIMEGMISPKPKADAPQGDQGYTDKERQEMNRAVQSTQ